VRYYVISSDGQRYGPADLPTLNQWIQEGRLLPNQMLEDEASGQRMPASSVSELNFPAQGAQQPGQPTYAPGQPYQQHYQRPEFGGDDGAGDLKSAWIYAVLGLCCCLFLDIPAFIYANKAEAKGNPGAKVVKIFLYVVIALQVIGIIYRVVWFANGGMNSLTPR
jgi:hypothetical protein